MNDDLLQQACWLVLAFKSGLPARVINDVIEIWCQQLGRTLKEFFAADTHEWEVTCNLQIKLVEKLEQAKEHLTEQALLVEQLSQDSIQLLTMLDEHYPKSLKSALKRNQIPPVLCYSGDLCILDRTTIAIIGSRNAGEVSLAFTREAAQYLAEHEANVISGNARGVDRAAFDGATTSRDGRTTVVLPHGIRKLSSTQLGELLPKIRAGQVLLLSQFHPDAIWFVSRAMERNKVVTALAQVVIVAESGIKGGTWEGANEALEQKRSLYVCQTLPSSSFTGNSVLIERGARPLYWPIEQSPPIDDVLFPLLQESVELCQRQRYMPSLSHQLSLLLKEHGVAYDHH